MKGAILLAFLLCCRFCLGVKVTSWTSRADAVKSAIRHAWLGYKKFAYMSDDLRPVSQTGSRWLHSRATLYDALDTLYLAGFYEEFDAVVHEINTEIMGPPTSVLHGVKVFEYHIRIVGGLLGAYSVSRKRELLLHAQLAADCVLSTFDSATGLPRMYGRMANPSTSPLLSRVAFVLDSTWAVLDKNAWCNTLSGIGSFGLELRALSRETGRLKYKHAAEKIEQVIYKEWKHRNVHEGFLHKYWNIPPPWLNRSTSIQSCGLTQREIAFGSGGDSFYEYLLKEQILAPRDTKHLAELYDAFIMSVHGSMNDGARSVVYTSSDNRHTLVHLNMRNISPHLVCFGGGLLALGALHFKRRKNDMQLAQEFGEQCFQFYKTPTGLAADVNEIHNDGTASPFSGHANYQLRPETVETLFILFRTTKNEKYREMGWEIFQAIEKHCKVQSGGYSGIKDVLQVPPEHDDYMPSFFLAETLKYLLLLFQEDEQLPLAEYIFTTEGHPISISPTCEPDTNEMKTPVCSGSSQLSVWQTNWDVVGMAGGLCVCAWLKSNKKKTRSVNSSKNK